MARGSKDGANTALHLVSAYASALGVSLGQEGGTEKGNVARRYFIVSTGIKTVEQFADAARAYWGVEAMH